MRINKHVIENYDKLDAYELSQFDSYTLKAFIKAVCKSWIEQNKEIDRLNNILSNLICEETHNWEI